MAAELVPLRHRSRVQSICYLFDSFNSIAVSFATLPVYNVLNGYTFLPLFVAPSIVILIYLYKYLPETKNQEICTIVEKLKRQQNGDGGKEVDGEVKAIRQRKKNVIAPIIEINIIESSSVTATDCDTKTIRFDVDDNK